MNLYFATNIDMNTFMNLYNQFYRATVIDSTKLKFFTNSDEGDWQRNELSYAPSWDTYFICNDIKKTITDRIDSFLNPDYKQKCIKFGKPYKLNILLYGVPGAGKTTLIKLLSHKYKRMLYLVSFTAKLNDSKLLQFVSGMETNPIIALEDIDSLYEERNSKCNVSFSGMINMLDGVALSDKGVITILTANHVDKLDSALLRPGRMDLIVKFNYPERTEIFEAFKALVKPSENLEDKFNLWYKQIRNLEIPMSGITDFLFNHPDDYLESIDLLIKNTKELKAIKSDANQEKMYL
jgi:SpoVK/Ycf46/Vps4 family AAA+-type ATPase